MKIHKTDFYLKLKIILFKWSQCFTNGTKIQKIIFQRELEKCPLNCSINTYIFTCLESEYYFVQLLLIGKDFLFIYFCFCYFLLNYTIYSKDLQYQIHNLQLNCGRRNVISQNRVSNVFSFFKFIMCYSKNSIMDISV